jgi:hypothetical protein
MPPDEFALLAQTPPNSGKFDGIRNGSNRLLDSIMRLEKRNATDFSGCSLHRWGQGNFLGIALDEPDLFPRRSL